MSAYPLYGSSPIRRQRGGWGDSVHDITQRRQAARTAALNAVKFLLPPLWGIAKGIELRRKNTK